MENENKYFEYFQAKQSKENLSLNFIRNKIILVNILLFLATVIGGVLIWFYNQDINSIVKYSFGLFCIILINFIFLNIKDNKYSYLSLSLYVTFFGIFILTINTIILFGLPSLTTFLLVGASFSMFFMNKNVSIMIIVFILFISLTLVINNIDIFITSGNIKPEGQLSFEVILFFISFVFIYSLQSYFLFNKRSKQLDHLAHIYESEFKNQDIVVNISNKEGNTYDKSKYIKTAKEIVKNLSEDINIEDFTNTFEDIINSKNIIKRSKEKIYLGEDDNIDYINHLYDFSLEDESKLRRLAVRAAFSGKKENINKNEDISEYIDSINNKNESIEVKIFLFSLFYATIRTKLPFKEALSDDDIYKIIVETNYSSNISSEILKVYRENRDVINDIYDQHFMGVKK